MSDPKMKLVWDINVLPPNVKKVAFIFYGSGDPSDQHDLVGVKLLDENDQPLFGVLQHESFEGAPEVIQRSKRW